MTTKVEQFIATHAESGGLNPEQAAQLLELTVEGDTSAQAPEQVTQPDATTEPDQAAAPAAQTPNNGEQQPAAEQQPDPATAVILAKDGKHTIPYQKLVDAREGEQRWKATAEATQAKLLALEAEAQQRADAGQAPTNQDKQVAAAQAAIDAGADPALFGDFSEESLAKGIESLVDARVAARVDAEVAKALAPLRAQQAQTASTGHIDAIYKAHPDADSMVESAELNAWIDTQPSFVRDGFRDVLKQGTSQQVIELFDSFKKATNAVNEPAPSSAGKATAPKAAVAVPATLSDLPGGRAGPASADEVLDSLSGPDLTERLMAMTQDQRDAFLNRRG
ncbi:hypothetical protein [Variovorax sp. EBFNA2]|uniref:hypothetical protein n=1 Tax=Variovorax sp. EBFNA2 TaxID=3342097 RepID=UPI0029BFFF54|nr:hypothetical protein [Variovorax boronicumulans]WPG35311.1 hypothetical protein RZE79_17645 [Variovorax boronicumulans]